MAEQPSRTPIYIAFAMIAGALILTAITGFSHGSIAGAILSLAAAVPAGKGIVNGLQEETQGGFALAVGALFCALAVAALLLVLKVTGLFH